MARKKKQEKEPNLERWLVSYADFITLLFAVFVVLYAMSQTDKKKVEQVIQSMQEYFGTSTKSSAPKPNVLDSTDMRFMPSIKPQITPPTLNSQRLRGDTSRRPKGRAEEKDLREIKATIDAYLLKHGAQEKVAVEINRRGLVVSLKEAGFFDSGSAEVRQSSFSILAKVAESLERFTNPIRVEGHTDTVPISTATFRSNWELSTSRATNIVHYLLNRYEFNPDKISATGYGEHRPVADNDAADGRAKNRRVDIVLLAGASEQGEP